MERESILLCLVAVGLIGFFGTLVTGSTVMSSTQSTPSIGKSALGSSPETSTFKSTTPIHAGSTNTSTSNYTSPTKTDFKANSTLSSTMLATSSSTWTQTTASITTTVSTSTPKGSRFSSTPSVSGNGGSEETTTFSPTTPLHEGLTNASTSNYTSPTMTDFNANSTLSSTMSATSSSTWSQTTASITTTVSTSTPGGSTERFSSSPSVSAHGGLEETTITFSPTTPIHEGLTNTSTSNYTSPTTTDLNANFTLSSTISNTSSSTGSRATASITTTDSTSQSKTTRTINIMDLSVSLTFSIKFNGSFDNELSNAGSSLYNRTKQRYEEQLTRAFNGTSYDLQRLVIVRFWNGSIGVDYEVYYKSSVLQDITVFASYLKATVLPRLETLPDVLDKSTIRNDFYTLDTQLRQMEDDPCEHHTCYNQGECVVRNENELYCRCVSDSAYVYSGEQCEVQTEKLKLSSTNIIIIAAGGGGGLVFILTVALLVTCLKRKSAGNEKQRVADDRKSEVSFNSHDGGHGGAVNEQPLPAQRLYRDQQHIAYAQQDTGLPLESPGSAYYSVPGPRPGDAQTSPGSHMMQGEDGRLYRVVKESQLYKPGGEKGGNSAFRNQAYENFPDDAPSRGDRQQSKPQYTRLSHPPQGGRRVADSVYSSVSDEYTIYQPSVGYTAGGGHLNPVVAADPNELSGFPRPDYARQEDRHVPASGGLGDSNLRRPEETRMFMNSKTPYSGRDTPGGLPDSGYRDGERNQRGGPPSDPRQQAPGYPTKEELVIRRDPYPSRTEDIYSRVSRTAPGGPAYGEDMRGLNPAPLIHDYSSSRINADVKPSYSSPYTSGADRSRGPQGHIYDYMDGRRF